MKKVCSAKDDAPIGEVVYEKDGYAIHRIDGEEHKVRSTEWKPSFPFFFLQQTACNND